MPGRIEAFQLDRAADFNDVASTDTAIHSRNAIAGIAMRDHFGAGRLNQCRVAARVIAVQMGIDDVADGLGGCR